ncbi:hypothetical protein BCR33DRAFT_852807 [Rhizoclosmatium globosum]|uniref:Aminopeptidase n=1 Tax=Rhizoclosmatium globosum TaxID=329046 RepID=A0A1Y2C0S0_9FUNG|nr:hypothetical protein BCR33DRAFT_852807 [Rhizoclosmatium globosum]|eukprot:ORY40504.1 hypothetical protein BCR33DRAFT_852807 [Rhizoclosmatium globosum]
MTGATQIKPEWYCVSVRVPPESVLLPTTSNVPFTGTVRIGLSFTDVEAVAQTTQININAAKSIKVTSAKLIVKLGKTKISLDTRSIDRISDDVVALLFTLQTVQTTAFEASIPEFELQIAFEGTIEFMDHIGFVRCPVEAEDDDEWSDDSSGDSDQPLTFADFVLATNLEPDGAGPRHVFPCFDHPALKASFEISIAAPKEYTVVSNAPVREVTEVSDALKQWTFEKTPPMSTYNVAWAMGVVSFVEGISSGTRHIPVRVYCPPGQEEDARFALEAAVNSLSTLEKIYKTPYSLPKLDLFPIPYFDGEALESYGLCLFQSSLLLLPPTTASPSDKMDVALLVSHELVHQWFGNLVTMKWWDDLWINEALADWGEYAPIAAWKPEWNVWDYFFENEDSLGFESDSTFWTHPMVHDVTTRMQVEGTFDYIAYKKGASVIRMFEHWVNWKSGSADSWNNILADFLTAHAFKNVTSQDFIDVLQNYDASGNLATVFKQWIELEGHPVVFIDEKTNTLRQEYFTLWKENKSVQPQTRYIPFSYQFVDLESNAITAIEYTNTSIPTPPSKTHILLPNPLRAGFYRFLPSSAHLSHILKIAPSQSPTIRAAFLSDLSALALSNRLDPPKALTAFETLLPQERHPSVWRVFILFILPHWRNLRGWTPWFTSKILFPVLDTIPWFPSEPNTDDFLLPQLQDALFPLAAQYSHPETMAHAKTLFTQWVKAGSMDDEPSEPIVETVYTALVLTAPEKAFKFLWDDDDDDRELPGDETERVGATAWSPIRKHWEVCLDMERVLEGLGFESIAEAKDAEVMVMEEWSDRVSMIVQAGFGGDREERCEVGWKALRGDAFGGGSGTIDEVTGLMEALRVGKKGGKGTGKAKKQKSGVFPQGCWNYFVKQGHPIVADCVEEVVAACEFQGDIWNDAVSCLGSGKEWKVKVSGESLVLTGVRKGLEKAWARAMFIEKYGNIMEQ